MGWTYSFHPVKVRLRKPKEQGAAKLSKNREIGAEGARKVWARPEVRKLDAGSAEANGTGINDGGPVGNARS